MRYLVRFLVASHRVEGLSQGSLLWNSHALGLTGSPALGMKLFRVSHLIAGQVMPRRPNSLHFSRPEYLSTPGRPVPLKLAHKYYKSTWGVWWGGAVTL